MNNDPFSEANGPQPSTSSAAEFHFQSQSQSSVLDQQRLTGNILIGSFVPPISSGIPGIESLAKSHPYLFPAYNVPHGCSIVVTIGSKGGYVWTFIPMARGPSPESLAVDEGDWPRKVSLLGETMLLTKERWDELKCDPDYDCYIPLPPGIPTVSRRAGTSKNVNINATESATAGTSTNTTAMPPPPVPKSPRLLPKRHNTRSPTPFPKRTASEFSDPLDSSPHKKQRTYVVSASESESESRSGSGSDTEIEELLSDTFKPKPFEATKSKLKRAQDREARAQDNLKSASFRMTNMINNLPNLSNTLPNANTNANANADGSASTSGMFSTPKKEREKVAMETDPVQTKRHWGYGSSPDTLDTPDEEAEDQVKQEPSFTSIHSSKRPRFGFDGFDERQRAWEKRYRELLRNNKRHTKSPSVGAGIGIGISGGVGRNKRRREEHFWQDVDFDKFKGRAFSVDVEESEETPTPATTEEYQHKQEQEQGQHHEPGTNDSPIYVSETDDDAEGETAGESTHSEGEKKSKRARFNPYVFDPDYRDPLEEEREAQIHASRRKLEELNLLDETKNAKRKLEEERRKLEEQLREARRRQQQQQQQQWQDPQRQRWRGTRPAAGDFWSDSQSNSFFTRAHWDDGYKQASGQPQGFNRYGNGKFHTNTNTNASGSGSSSSRRHTSNPSSSNAYQRIPTSISSAWTPRNALERYNKLSTSFDNFKPTPEKPLPTLDEIPWPVLLAPGFALDQVDWTTVEKFFSAAEALMAAKSTTSGKAAWKEFLKASTRRFHPDRWRARGFIGDKGYGADVEDRVNHVAKVLTPLYRAVT